MRSRSRCLPFVLLIVLGGCLRERIHEDDLPLLVTLDDLKPYGFDLDSLADRQVFRRSRYIDGSLDIEHEFESPDDLEKPLYLATTVTFDRSATDARASYALMKGTFAVGTRLGGARVRGENSFFQWGDDSFFGYLDTEHGPGGNVFITRLAHKTYLVAIGGLYFDDADEWTEFITPKLEYLRGYQPRKR